MGFNEDVERLLREMDRPKVLGDYRRDGFRALKITCCKCWQEGEVPFDRIPLTRDRWPLKWLKFPHKGCGHTGCVNIHSARMRGSLFTSLECAACGMSSVIRAN